VLRSLLSGNPELHRPNCEFLSVSKIDNLKAQINLHVSNRTHRAFVAPEETTRSRSSQANTSKKTQTCLPNLRSMSAVLLGFLWQRAANLRRNPMRATEAWPLLPLHSTTCSSLKRKKAALLSSLLNVHGVRLIAVPFAFDQDRSSGTSIRAASRPARLRT
jgi:hypothetical protein